MWAKPNGAEFHSTGQWVENLLRNGRQVLDVHVAQGTLKVVESFKFDKEPSVCIKRR